ncbi:MAG: glycoside hydrolase family 108 protein [Nitrososphaera sp.]
MDFDTAFARVIGAEGGFQNDPQDRGNWTSGIIGKGKLKGTAYGISAMSYPDLDIQNLTVEDSKKLYRRDFWERVHGDTLYDGVAYQLFDFAVNSGIQTAIRKLQRAVGVADDGIWGPVSAAAEKRMTESTIIMLFIAERLDYLTSLSAWPRYGKGWARRAAGNLRYGSKDS